MDDEQLALTKEHEENNDYILEAMALALTAWLLSMASMSRSELRDYIYKTFPLIVGAYQEAAILQSYAYYVNQRVLANVDTPLTSPSNDEISAARNNSTKTGVIVSSILKHSSPRSFITDAMIKSVISIASNAVLETDKSMQVILANRDSVRTRTIWTAEAGACKFCSDLDGTVAKRINSHDNCRCILVTEFY